MGKKADQIQQKYDEMSNVIEGFIHEQTGFRIAGYIDGFHVEIGLHKSLYRSTYARCIKWCLDRISESEEGS